MSVNTSGDYHSDDVGAKSPSLSASIAKILLDKSPYHAWCAHPKLGNLPREESKTFDDGSAAHALLFGERQKLVIVDADDWRSKMARIARDEARAAHKIPILSHQVAGLEEMARIARLRIESCDINSDGYRDINLDGGSAEHPIVWHEEEHDVWCRSKLDWLSADRRLIVDYKTTTTAEPNAFSRQIFSMRYELQAAFYRRAVLKQYGAEADYLWLVQENEPPYACSVLGLAPSTWELGEKERAHAVALWGKCLRENLWPSYTDRISYVEPPAWVYTQWEERRAMDSEDSGSVNSSAEEVAP